MPLCFGTRRVRDGGAVRGAACSPGSPGCRDGVPQGEPSDGQRASPGSKVRRVAQLPPQRLPSSSPSSRGLLLCSTDTNGRFLRNFRDLTETARLFMVPRWRSPRPGSSCEVSPSPDALWDRPQGPCPLSCLRPPPILGAEQPQLACPGTSGEEMVMASGPGLSLEGGSGLLASCCHPPRPAWSLQESCTPGLPGSLEAQDQSGL